MNPVVITRPAAQAEALALRLSASGCPVRLFPLLEIQPLADTTELGATLAKLNDYAMVAFVSPNAIDAVFAHLTDWPNNVIAAVVGEGSRLALARHGVTDANATIISPTDKQRTDSETLIVELDLDALRGKKVLIVRAESGRELLADQLRAAGVDVKQIVAYQRLAPTLDEARLVALRTLLAEQNDWIITSSEALRLLKQMVEQADPAAGWQHLQNKTLILPHPRIAETANELGFTHTILCGSGDEALLGTIQSRT
ncbi:MAG: uroporphyrinogen-III synthase [Burkholderiales bacterium]|nr:uroporphyrinogen-III synthase [Burkholderiales bacterium]